MTERRQKRMMKERRHEAGQNKGDTKQERK